MPSTSVLQSSRTSTQAAWSSTSLLCAIDSVQTSTLDRIHADINTMVGKKSTFLQQGSAAYMAPYPPGNMAVATSAITIPHVKDSTGGFWEHGQNFGFSRGPAPSSAFGGIYIEEPFAGNGCKQINGASIEISPGSEQLMSHISVPHQVRIIRPINVGQGDQVNGVDLKTIGEVGAFGGTQINGYRSRRRSKRRATIKKGKK